MPSRQLTFGRYDEEGIRWSPDGTRIIFTSDRVDEPYYNTPDVDAYTVAATGGSIEKLIDIDGPVRDVAPSPSGHDYTFAGWVNPPKRQSYTQSAVFLFRNGAVTTLLKGGDGDIGSAVTGDQHPPRGGGATPLVWTHGGQSVVTAVTEHGQSNLVGIDVTSRAVVPLTIGAHDVVAYTATADGGRFAVTLSDATHIGDLYVLDAGTRGLTQLTHVNDSLWATLRLSTPERISYRSFDGKMIEAWVYKPLGFLAGREIPAHSEHSRRPARRMGRHVLPGSTGHGRPWLRGLASQPAGQHVVRRVIR